MEKSSSIKQEFNGVHAKKKSRKKVKNKGKKNETAAKE